jgi:hypothetical protein
MLSPGLLVRSQAAVDECSVEEEIAESSFAASEAAAEAPSLAAVLLYRTLNLTNLNKTLASIADLVDAIVLVPPGGEHHQPSPHELPLEVQEKLVPHRVHWTVDFGQARNIALNVAQEQGKCSVSVAVVEAARFM